LAGLFFENAAEVIGSRKTAEAGDDVQRVLPVEQQPHGRFDPDRGEVAPRRHPHRSGEGADEVALGDAQPLAELFHAVEARVVLADVLDGGGDEGRQRRGSAVRARKLAQQGKDQLARHPAVVVRRLVPGGCGKAAHQLSGGRAGLAAGEEGQLGKPGEELGGGLAGELDAEQVAASFRGEGQRRAAQDQVPGGDALGRQDEG